MVETTGTSLAGEVPKEWTDTKIVELHADINSCGAANILSDSTAVAISALEEDQETTVV